jgi:hypothetical protein
MKDSRVSYLIPVGAAIAGLVLSLMIYAGFLTSDWITILASIPAIVGMIAIVAGMLGGMLFFEAEEAETPEEASRPDGRTIFDWLGSRTTQLFRRLHARGVEH